VASSNIGSILLVPSRGSTALALIGPRRIEARGSWLLQGALLREVSRLTIGVAATSLDMRVGVDSVAVTSLIVPASWTVASELAVGIIGPGGLRCKPLRGWHMPC
jgi:hypothetical protein